MNHADEMEAAGRWVSRAREELDRAMTRAQERAVAAHADGVPVTTIARALGVTRVTVYAWINDQ